LQASVPDVSLAARRTALPPEVTVLVGETPRPLTGYGEARVVAGQGRVAKLGPRSVIVREARILCVEAGRLPLALPEPVATGPGWLVMQEVPDHGGRWDERGFATLLGDLARLHDAFEGSPVLGGEWLRDPAGLDLAATLAEGQRGGIELPEPLARVLSNPRPIADVIARSRPLTLVHGDPTPENVRRPPHSSVRSTRRWCCSSSQPTCPIWSVAPVERRLRRL